MTHKIILNHEDAEKLAYSFSKYSLLLSFITMYPNEETYVIYGNRNEIVFDLQRVN